jgi:hypothetical protein
MKYFIVLTLFLLPALALAAVSMPVYQPLVGIPGINTAGSTDFDLLINTLYGLSISVAALLAVIKIVIAGVKYMLTDIVTTKGAAKTDIQNALIGLSVVLGAVLILNVINPKLTEVVLVMDSENITTAFYVPPTITSTLSPTAYTWVSIATTASTSIQNSGLISTTDPNYPSFFAQCTSTGNHTAALVKYGNTFRCLFKPRTSSYIKSFADGVENVSAACTSSGGEVTPDITNPGYSWCVSTNPIVVE